MKTGVTGAVKCLKFHLKSSPPTKQHAASYGPDALLVAQELNAVRALEGMDDKV